jgi:hypothetical protein
MILLLLRNVQLAVNTAQADGIINIHFAIELFVRVGTHRWKLNLNFTNMVINWAILWSAHISNTPQIHYINLLVIIMDTSCLT